MRIITDDQMICPAERSAPTVRGFQTLLPNGVHGQGCREDLLVGGGGGGGARLKFPEAQGSVPYNLPDFMMQ